MSSRVPTALATLSVLVSLGAQTRPPADSPPPVLTPLKTSVTVTGTRTATELDRAPVSTSLIAREELESRNVNQVDQVLATTEGFNAYRTKGAADNDFGIGMRGFSGRGGQARTLVLMDGQPINDSYTGAVNWALLPVGELERVEVVRGPFSSLYGGNAMGGVINLITRPVDRRRLEFSSQYGSMGTTTYALSAGERFFNRLGLSVGFQRYQTNGYADQPVLKSATTSSAAAIPVTGVQPWATVSGGVNYQTGMRGEEWFNGTSARGRGEYSFSSKTFASVQYLHQRRGSGYDAFSSALRNEEGLPVSSGLVGFRDPSGTLRLLSVAPADFIGTPTGSTVDTWQAQLLSTLSPHCNLRLLGGLNRIPSQWYTTPASTATLTSGGGSFTNTATRAIFGSAQLGWNFRHRHQLIFGADTRHDRANIEVTNVPTYTSRANRGPMQSQAGGESINQSAFAQDQYSVSDKLTLVLGGRYDYWRSYDGLNQRSATAPVLTYPGHGTHAVTGKAAAAWQAPARIQVRGSLGTAFRNPTIYELYRDLPIGSSLYLANPNANPERLLSYEVGAQRRLGPLNLDAAYYENRVRDLLYRASDFASDPTGRTLRLTNAAMARTRGVELAARQRATRWLELRQTYTYTNAIITDNAPLPATIGKRVPYVPAHSSSFIALIGSRRFSGSVSGRYQGAVYSTDVNSDRVRGVPGSYNPFFTADLSAGFNLTGQVTVTANLYNLLDRRYYLGSYIVPGRQGLVGLRIRI